MRLYNLDKYMKFETEKINFKQLPIEKIVLNSKIFLNLLKVEEVFVLLIKKKLILQ